MVVVFNNSFFIATLDCRKNAHSVKAKNKNRLCDFFKLGFSEYQIYAIVK